MRALVWDEMRPDDLAKVRAHLAERLPQSRLGDVFWLELPERLLSEEQKSHAQGCGPHRVAVVLEAEAVRLELLVRASQSLRCACTAYADPAQRDFCLEFLDRLLEETGART